MARKRRRSSGFAGSPEEHYQQANRAAADVIRSAGGVKRTAPCGKKLNYLLLAYRDAGRLDTEEQSAGADAVQGDKARSELESASNNFEDRCMRR